MRDKNGKYTNMMREQARARRVYTHAIRAGYAQGSASMRISPAAYLADGVWMLDRAVPYTVKDRKINAKVDGNYTGKAIGYAALWAGVSLEACL